MIYHRSLVALLAGALACNAAVARAAMLYVSEAGGGSVVSYNTAVTNPTAKTFASGFNQAFGLAFDSAGNLFVANDGIIDKFTPGGVGSVFATTDFSQETALAIDSAGNVYATGFIATTIERFSPTGVDLGVFASTGLGGPVSMAFDATGNLYVSNGNSNTIEKFTPGGVGSVFASTGLDNPSGLAFDAAGNLYVGNVDSYTIEKFSPDGAGSVFATKGILGSFGLAFDPVGNLYVTDFIGSDRIDVFTPNGVGSLFVTNGKDPEYIAFAPTAVPQPSSLALACLAVVSLGLFACARHRFRRLMPD